MEDSTSLAGRNVICSLPAEVLDMIMDFVLEDQDETPLQTLSRLSQTCRTLKARVSPRLYADISSVYTSGAKIDPLAAAISSNPSLGALVRSLHFEAPRYIHPRAFINGVVVPFFRQRFGRAPSDAVLARVDPQLDDKSRYSPWVLACLMIHMPNLGLVSLDGREQSWLDTRFLEVQNGGRRASTPLVTFDSVASLELRGGHPNRLNGLFLCLPNLAELTVINSEGFSGLRANFPNLSTLKLFDCGIAKSGIVSILKTAKELTRFEYEAHVPRRDIKPLSVLDCLINAPGCHRREKLERMYLHVGSFRVETTGRLVPILPFRLAVFTGLKYLTIDRRNLDRSADGVEVLKKLYFSHLPTLLGLAIIGIEPRESTDEAPPRPWFFREDDLAELADEIIRRAERPSLTRLWLRAGDGWTSDSPELRLLAPGDRDRWRRVREWANDRYAGPLAALGVQVRLDFWDDDAGVEGKGGRKRLFADW
ncbi:hypothetical protein QBC43DRAFT_289367 [Cladorrhinum sp. PSN259]|nr:hypothetical protein QBC43DRAFT_289367 [Cladorrhinum sp. PSN259]